MLSSPSVNGAGRAAEHGCAHALHHVLGQLRVTRLRRAARGQVADQVVQDHHVPGEVPSENNSNIINIQLPNS